MINRALATDRLWAKLTYCNPAVVEPIWGLGVWVRLFFNFVQAAIAIWLPLPAKEITLVNGCAPKEAIAIGISDELLNEEVTEQLGFEAIEWCAWYAIGWRICWVLENNYFGWMTEDGSP